MRLLKVLGLGGSFAGAVYVVAACSGDDMRQPFIEPFEAAAPDTGPPDAGPNVPDCVPGTGATTTKSIDENGGSISLDSITLTIPPNALAAATPITITSSQNCPWPAAGFTPITPLYEFGPEGLEFDAPVTLEIGYPGAQVPAILAFTNEIGDLADVPADNEGSSITAQVTHFSDAVVGTYVGQILTPAQVVFMAAVPSTIDVGDHATLELDASGNFAHDDCTLDQGLGPVPWKTRLSVFDTVVPYAKLDLTPTQTTTYTLTCPTANIKTSQTITVSSPPLLTLTSDKPAVNAGDTATLSWTISPNVTFDTCLLNGESVVTFSSTKIVTPATSSASATDALYALQCADHTKHVLERRLTIGVSSAGVCAPVGSSCDPNALDDGCCAPSHCDPSQSVCALATDGGAPDAGTPDAGSEDAGDAGEDAGSEDAGDAGEDAGSEDAGDAGDAGDAAP